MAYLLDVSNQGVTPLSFLFPDQAITKVPDFRHDLDPAWRSALRVRGMQRRVLTKLYSFYREKETFFPQHAADPAYKQKLVDCYPIHPELRRQSSDCLRCGC